VPDVAASDIDPDRSPGRSPPRAASKPSGGQGTLSDETAEETLARAAVPVAVRPFASFDRSCICGGRRRRVREEQQTAGDSIPPECELIEVHIAELKRLFNPRSREIRTPDRPSSDRLVRRGVAGRSRPDVRLDCRLRSRRSSRHEPRIPTINRSRARDTVDRVRQRTDTDLKSGEPHRVQ
jgi:hypothetical protein